MLATRGALPGVLAEAGLPPALFAGEAGLLCDHFFALRADAALLGALEAAGAGGGSVLLAEAGAAVPEAKGERYTGMVGTFNSRV
jgi:hypothetical protein